MADYGGIASSVPVLTTCMIVSVLASAGLPGLNGFVGEFMILVGSMKSTVLDMPMLVALATTGVILAAVYLLYMVYRTFFGTLTIDANKTMPDLNLREFGLLAPLLALMLIMGFFPNPFLQLSEPTTAFLLETVETKRQAAIDAAEAAAAPSAEALYPDAAEAEADGAEATEAAQP
jgi:NADH-quinone oxidoreductase subunit M